jgi:hypothetical protein
MAMKGTEWSAQIYTITLAEPTPQPGAILKEGYSAHSQAIAKYLTTLREPTHIEPWQRRQFKREALKYFVDHGHLFLRAKEGEGRRVVDNDADRRRIFETCHQEVGHRGREATYIRVTRHYYWKGMYAKVADWVRECPDCQQHDAKRYEEAAGWTHPSPHPTAKWHLDIQYMPSGQRGKKCYLLEARDDLTGYLEAEIVPDKSAKCVRRFLEIDIFLRWGLPLCVVVDGGSEFKGEVTEILKMLGVQRVTISPHNSRANGINEQGQIPIATALAKMMNSTGRPLESLASIHDLCGQDRSERPAKGTSFFMMHNYDPISPIENDVPSWRMIDWDSISPRRRKNSGMHASGILSFEPRFCGMRSTILRSRPSMWPL